MKLLIIISFLFLSSCYSKQRCVYVSDGDTIIMQDGTKIRLAEIDAPEHNQDGGREAKQYLSSLVLNKTVGVRKVSEDKYGRDVCKLYRDGVYINESMVISGNAWAYKHFSSTKLHNKELEARRKKIGLWSKPNMPPYLFRKTHFKP